MSNKKKTIRLILFIAVILVGTPIAMRGHEEIREHYPFRIVGKMPKDNGVPRIYLETENGTSIQSKEAWVKGTLRTTVKGKETMSAEVSLKGRGNTTWKLPKKGYAVKFASKTTLLGMPEGKRWALLANYSDKTLLRNEFALYLGANLYNNLSWTPRFEQVELFLNKKYIGVYLLVEQVKIDKARVNVPDFSKLKDYTQGGYVYEVNNRLDEIHNFQTTKGVPFSLKEPDDVPEELFVYSKKHMQHIEDVLFSDSFADPQTGWRTLIDMDSLIDWYIINELTKNHDAHFEGSVFMYYNPNDKLVHFGPVWDFDISAGNIDYDNCDNPEGYHVRNAVWLERMFGDPVFTAALKNRWNETKQGLREAINEYIPQRAGYLNRAQEYNFKAWKILDIDVWPNALVTGSYQGETGYLILWLNKRFNWMNTALNQL